MKTSLNLKTGQQLALTPQLQQAIRLLQISTTELHEELEEAASSNPLLEVEELQENLSANNQSPQEKSEKLDSSKTDKKDNEEYPLQRDENIDFKEINQAEEWAQISVRKNNNIDDGNDLSNNLNEDPVTLSRHLQSQLGTMTLSKKERTWVEILIQALDSDGYLRESVEELELPFSKEFEEEFGERFSEEELQIGVKLLQSLDPIGIGAKDLSECLILQLNSDEEKTPTIEAAKLILSNHLELLAQHNISGLIKASGLTRELIHAADIKIKQLNPKPASAFRIDVPITVIPDVVVYKDSTGLWRARLNSAALPKVRIHENYAKTIQDSGSLKGPLNQQLLEARWMIKNVQQRFDTILRVTQVIVEVQQDFFEFGPRAMRPLVLRDVAARCNLHESTVSRVTNQKYVATPIGCFELKYFFGSHVLTEDGGSASGTSIKA
jgi:RNA polymerase sigma-54 factor